MSADGDSSTNAGGPVRRRRGRPEKSLDIAGLDPILREFARELKKLKRDQTLKDLKTALPWSTSEFSKAFNAHKLPPLGLVAALAGYRGEDVGEWELKWAAVRRHLEKAGRTDLIQRSNPQSRDVLQANAAEAEAMLRTIEVQALDSRLVASLKAESLLAELDEKLPTGTSKNGDNPAQCWHDLADYLRRLVLLFDPRPIETGGSGPVGITDVLPRLADLAQLTGVQQWVELADQIGTTFDTARESGWLPTGSSPQSVAWVYLDRFASFRVTAGGIASRLARGSGYLTADAVLVEPALVGVDHYDPPRSYHRHIIFCVMGMLILGTGVLLLRRTSGQEWMVWGAISFGFLAFIGMEALQMVNARED
ncbi:hypothetical protein [Kitasatospora sp. GP82]|uniref:hypothetical protein n=1 Tax=Kitasatospora sp. GP82 TaxID=3035089 RepID=UPI0024743DEA|nr:hypothetical protein [Kitasatospora sp. GP82]MDH6129262.1 hypothetical protein [Kitasatospora sp. GP82]